MGQLRSKLLLGLIPLFIFPVAYAVIGITLNVGSNVVLQYGGTVVPWPNGVYGNCFVSSSATNCLISNGSGGQFGGLILIGVLIVGFMLVAVLVAKKR